MEKVMVNRKEAAEMMGISLPTLDAYLKRAKNPIPHIKAGRRILISTEGLREWISKEMRAG